jgi:flagellar assembly protein FliH
LSTKGCVVKSCDIEVFAPHLVKRKLEILQVQTPSRENDFDEQVQYPPQADLLEMSLLVAEAEEKAAVILAQAEEDARNIRTQAEADALTIRDQAQIELDRLRAEVIEAAQAEVYPKAKAEGYEAGMQEGKIEGDRLSQKANKLFRMAQKAVQDEYSKSEEELIHLVIKIAERIIKTTLAVDPQLLKGIIGGIVLLPEDRQGWRLHVSLEDSRWLEQDQIPCPLVIDEYLNPGDCYLDCPEGIYDARIEAQLDKFEHMLREELKHGSLEPVDSEGGGD